MKIKCDVCNNDEALVFCTADEAALCDGCDHRVHHANKLASKHQRFSLHHPQSPNDYPFCDICKERRAFLFCLQDRAILCKDCDGPIHTANEYTLKHTRFLLTGIKLSATSSTYVSPSRCSPVAPNFGGAGASVLVPDSNNSLYQQQMIKKPVMGLTNEPSSGLKSASLVNDNKNKSGLNCHTNEGIGSTNTNSISEYFIETLPGWHVDDLLDSSSTPFGFCKADDPFGLLSFSESSDFDVLNKSNLSSTERLGICVPQPTQNYQEMSSWSSSGVLKETVKYSNPAITGPVNNRRWTDTDDLFAVPQMNFQSIASNKRSRTLW